MTSKPFRARVRAKMSVTGWMTWVPRFIVVTVLIQFSCDVDRRSPLTSVDAGPLSGGGSGSTSSPSGAGGQAPDADAPDDIGEVIEPEVLVTPVPPGGSCTALGPPCSSSTCVAGICTVQCDPIRPEAARSPLNSCAIGQACSVGTDGTRCRALEATAIPGANCARDEDCNSGQFCGQAGQCRQYCVEQADCATGVCGLFREPRFSGGIEVGACSEGPCDPSHPQRPREGLGACPPGQNCRSTSTGESYCEAAGTDAFHQPCAGDSCAPGLFCGTGSLAGACNRYCIDATDCPANERCEAFTTPSFSGTAPVGFCRSVCDPVNGQSPTPPLTSCETGFACNAADEGGSYCRLEGFATQYGVCASNVDCAAGFACGTISDACVPHCFGNEDCATGACNPFSPPQFAGARAVGSCAEICDPVSPQTPRAPLAACPTGFRCHAGNADGLSFCGRAGPSRAGAACAESSNCAEGHYCSASVCRQYCYTDADCDSGSCAEAVTSNAIAGTFSVFTCALVAP
jgi:hypothetical protein